MKFRFLIVAALFLCSLSVIVVALFPLSLFLCLLATNSHIRYHHQAVLSIPSLLTQYFSDALRTLLSCDFGWTAPILGVKDQESDDLTKHFKSTSQ